MKEQIKIKNKENEHKNALLIEMIRKVIEDGGDNKLKASMLSVFDGKKINLDVVKTDFETFKDQELTNIIKNEIKIYDEEKDIFIARKIEEVKNELKNGKILKIF